MSDVSYIGEAVKLAANYFNLVGIEVYPLNTEEYAYIHDCGADYVCVYQETYNTDTYERIHLSGNKRIYPYRFNSQERAIKGGMRGAAFGALLGLDDFRKMPLLLESTPTLYKEISTCRDFFFSSKAATVYQ